MSRQRNWSGSDQIRRRESADAAPTHVRDVLRSRIRAGGRFRGRGQNSLSLSHRHPKNLFRVIWSLKMPILSCDTASWPTTVTCLSARLSFRVSRSCRRSVSSSLGQEAISDVSGSSRDIHLLRINLTNTNAGEGSDDVVICYLMRLYLR